MNLFKPNEISHSYQLNQSISVLIVAGWYFSFHSNFNRIFCKQTVETLIRRQMWRLIWVYTVCLCPTKRVQCLVWVNNCSSLPYKQALIGMWKSVLFGTSGPYSIPSWGKVTSIFSPVTFCEKRGVSNVTGEKYYFYPS